MKNEKKKRKEIMDKTTQVDHRSFVKSLFWLVLSYVINWSQIRYYNQMSH